MPKTGPEKKSVRSRQNSRSTSVTTKSVPELTGSIKMKERKSNEKDEKSMCSVTRSVVRFPACLSVRRRGQQQQRQQQQQQQQQQPRALAEHCRQYHRFP